MVKNLPATAGDQEARVQSLGREDSLEREMATHSSILAWETLWTEEPAGLQPMGSQRVSCNLVTKQQEYCSGSPFPSPGDRPNAGIEPASCALAGRFFPAEPPGKPL